MSVTGTASSERYVTSDASYWDRWGKMLTFFKVFCLRVYLSMFPFVGVHMHTWLSSLYLCSMHAFSQHKAINTQVIHTRLQYMYWCLWQLWIHERCLKCNICICDIVTQSCAMHTCAHMHLTCEAYLYVYIFIYIYIYGGTDIHYAYMQWHIHMYACMHTCMPGAQWHRRMLFLYVHGTACREHVHT
jgi:hypothetical protein